jgi:hypothetical protein
VYLPSPSHPWLGASVLVWSGYSTSEVDSVGGSSAAGCVRTEGDADCVVSSTPASHRALSPMQQDRHFLLHSDSTAVPVDIDL